MIRQRGPQYWIVELYDSDLKRKFQVRPADYGKPTPKSEREAIILEELAKQAGASMTPPLTVRLYAERFTSRQFNHAGHVITAQTNTHNAKRLRPFVDRYGDLPLRQIGAKEASEFSLDPETRSNAREVKTMFANALRDGVIDSDPFAAISFQQRGKTRRKAFLRKHDVEALAEAALIAHEEWGPTYRAWILFMAWTGLRPGEAAGAQWKFYDPQAQIYDVQFQYHGSLRKLVVPKHESVGTVHVFEPAVEALASLDRSSEFMFPAREGGLMDSSTMTNTFKPVRLLAGLPKATPGALRHFLASYMLNELALPPYTIAQQLRHSDGGRLVVQTYGHPDRAMHLSRIAQAEADGAFVGQGEPGDTELR